MNIIAKTVAAAAVATAAFTLPAAADNYRNAPDFYPYENAATQQQQVRAPRVVQPRASDVGATQSRQYNNLEYSFN